MKKLFTVLVVLVLSAIVSVAQTTCARHTEPLGRFSYCPPADWTLREPRSGPYKSFFAPDGGAVRGNFNLKTETVVISHEAYMVAALRILLRDNEEKGDGATKLITWTEFNTDSKLTGSRLVYETLYDGTLLRTIQYILDLPGKKLILTGTSLARDKETTDKIFAGVAQSIRSN